MLYGYIAKQYYLSLDIDTDIETCLAGKSVITLSLVDELKTEYQKQLVDISRKNEELGKKEQALKDKENQINNKATEINQKDRQNTAKEQSINEQEYQFYCKVLGSGHCKEAYVKEII